MKCIVENCFGTETKHRIRLTLPCRRHLQDVGCQWCDDTCSAHVPKTVLDQFTQLISFGATEKLSFEELQQDDVPVDLVGLSDAQRFANGCIDRIRHVIYLRERASVSTRRDADTTLTNTGALTVFSPDAYSGTRLKDIGRTPRISNGPSGATAVQLRTPTLREMIGNESIDVLIAINGRRPKDGRIRIFFSHGQFTRILQRSPSHRP